jgi:hypothetical protein
MTIEQTIEIPESHRVFLDLPPELPAGKAKITITPHVEKQAANVHETIESLRGFAQRMGSTLTVDSFLEMRREDLRLEEAKYKNLFKENG